MTTASLRAVIFDFGNVVIKWQPYQALSHLFADEAEMAQKLDEIGFFAWNAEQDRGRSWEDGFAAAEAQHPQDAHIFRAYHAGLGPAHSTLVPGTDALIEALHTRGLVLLGLTNAARASYEVIRAAAPALGHLSDVVVSADVGLIKPDAAIFDLLLKRNGLSPQEALFIDDSRANCDAAAALGIAAHHFKNSDNLAEDLRRRALI